MTKILPVIMCGGSGTRVWPESRETLPKQFIPLIGERSTFQTTMQMLDDPAFERPIVISSVDYRFLLTDQLREIGAKADIVLEPMRRDSGPAVAVAAGLAARRSPGTVVVVLAADHVVRDQPGLVDLCKKAAAAAREGYIVTLGVKPDSPATGYGYLRAGAPLTPGGDVLKLEAFVEKPDRATAQGYVDAGYYWNSGNFIFRADVMQAEIAKFEPEIFAAAEAAIEAATTDLGFLVLDAAAFEQAPQKSIDYAVMEKTQQAALIPADIGWSDVGSWRAVWELSDRDAHGNSVRGNGVVMDATNVHVRSDETSDHDRRRQRRDRGDDAGRRAGAAPRSRRQGQAARGAAEAREPARGGRAQAHFPALGLLSIGRRRLALSGQAHRGEAGRAAVAAKAFSPRRALDRREGHGGSRPRRRDASRA